MSTIPPGTPGVPQAPAQPRSPLPKSDIARDAGAALLLIISLFLNWNNGDTSATIWWVILTNLILLASLSVSYLAHFGVFGPTWNVGYNRLVRLGAGIPFAGAVLATFIIDIVDEKGIQAGVVVGVFALILAIQPRAHERGVSAQPSVEDTIWFWLAPGFAALGALFIIGATLFRIGDLNDGYLGAGGVKTIIWAIAVIIVLVAIVALPVLGAVQRNAAWTNVLAVLGAYVVTVYLLLQLFGTLVHHFVDIVLSPVSFVRLFRDFSDFVGSTIHAHHYGVWFFAIAGAAAFAPGARAFIGDRLTPEVRQQTLGKSLFIVAGLVALQLVTSVWFLAISIDFEEGAGSIVFFILSILFYLAFTAAFVLAGGYVLRGTGQLNVSVPSALGKHLPVVVAGAYFVVSLLLTFLGLPMHDYTIGWSWFGPLLILIAVVIAHYGVDALKSQATAAAQKMQVPNEGAAPAAPAPAAPQPAAPAEPVAPQPEAPAAPAEPAPAAPAPAPAPPAADPIATELANPQLDAARLADIARDYPQHRAAVAAHPNAYEGLLEWLGSLGDPAVNAAIAARKA